MLNCLFNAGVNGARWHIIQRWYNGATARVKLGTTLSDLLHGERGVRQGSVLSPTLFLVIMDDLLRELIESSQGTTIEGHADDIHTLGSSISTVENQAKTLLSNVA